MSYNINEKIDQLYNKIVSVNTLNSLITNPFITAVLIVLCMILIFLYVREDDMPKWMLISRLAVYGFIITAFILFMNNKQLKNELTKNKQTSEMKEIIGSFDPNQENALFLTNEALVPINIDSSKI